MIKNKKLMMLSFLIIVLLGLSFEIYGVIGVRKNGLESDARKSQKIDETWVSAKDINDEMGALLFYDKALEQHTYAIYSNRPGFSYGYFFSRGGISSVIDQGIQGFSSEKGMVLMSVNRKKISEIKLENKSVIEIVRVDSAKPFVLWVPKDIEKVSLSDTQGNDVSIDNIMLQ